MREKLPGVLVQAGMPGQDLPGPGRVHHETAGIGTDQHPQPESRRAVPAVRAEHPPRRLVRVEMPRVPVPAAIASSSGASSLPACATVPASVAGEISAPCRARPVTSEFADRPASNLSTSSIAVNPFVNRPFPIALGGPGAITVSGPSHRHSLLYRRLQFATRRMITCQSSCSPDQ